MLAEPSFWSYTRCPDCPNDHQQVFPCGPLNARVMLIGEGPGWNEDRDGIPFVGKAGQELDATYLYLAGLNRSEVFVTNMVQCRQERNNVDVKPGAKILSSCMLNHLAEEIFTVQPEIIILMGATACTLIPNCNLEMEHGFPRKASILDWECTAIPMYHPAAGLHESRFMIPMLEDWDHLGKWFCGRWAPPVPPNIEPVYRLIRPGEFWDLVQPEPELYEYLPVDTESDEGRPWSIQFSTQPGHAFMILMTDDHSLSEFAQWLLWSYDTKVVLHNAPADEPTLQQVVGNRTIKSRDTMQELFHLGNMPQGLKVAVYRALGHRMISYDETVTPHSKHVLCDWLAGSLSYASESLCTRLPHPVGKGCPTCGKGHKKDRTEVKPHACEAVLRRVMGKLMDDSSEYEPWQPPQYKLGVPSYRLIGQRWLSELESVSGRMPRKSIIHVPLEEAVHYGCSDADWTGRLSVWLDHERERITREEWKVA